ncbi:MAG: ATPase [Bacteroidaceae bacterium]|nr:ATPase [Bacteroidaceae bacterium]
MIIIADSGSTKTEWIVGELAGLSVTTKGINPVRDTKEEILDVLSTELMPELLSSPTIRQSDVTEIHFYGAGCIPPFSQSVKEALEEHFPQAIAHVYSDLLGAVRALCGREEGIACILGTGSNSCLCKEGEIVKNTSPLGYILGDEGSGAVLGRTLLSEMLKGNLQDLWEDFTQRYSLSVSDIINKVYRQPQANRFLASLVPFIKEHADNPSVNDMVVNEFTRFLQRNVIPYGRPDLPVNFVGGVANNFTDEIKTACTLCGLNLGKIIARPAEEMRKYHFYVI